jgi:hypothetical protein
VEKVYFEERQKVEAVTDAFEELKRKSEEERKARLEKYKDGKVSEPEVKPEDLDPDNPENYIIPEELLTSRPSTSRPSESRRVKRRGVTFADDGPPGDEDSSSMTSLKDSASPGKATAVRRTRVDTAGSDDANMGPAGIDEDSVGPTSLNYSSADDDTVDSQPVSML